MIVIEPLGDLGRTYRYGRRTVSRQASAAEIARRREAATARRLRTRRYGIRTVSTADRRAAIARAEQARAATSASRDTGRRTVRRPSRRRATRTRTRARTTRTRRPTRSRSSSRAAALARSRAKAAARRRRVYYTTSPNDRMIQQALKEVMQATGLKGGEQITDIDALERMVTARLQKLTQTTRKIARGTHIREAIANVKISEPWESKAAKMRPHVRETQERKLKETFFRSRKPRKDLPASWAKMVEVTYGGQAMPHWTDYFAGRLTVRELEDRVAADYLAGLKRWEALRAEYWAAVNAWHEGGQIGPRPVRTF